MFNWALKTTIIITSICFNTCSNADSKMIPKKYSYDILLPYKQLSNNKKSVQVTCENKVVFNGFIADNLLTGIPSASRNNTTESRLIRCQILIDSKDFFDYSIDLGLGSFLVFQLTEENPKVNFIQQTTEPGYD